MRRIFIVVLLCACATCLPITEDFSVNREKTVEITENLSDGDYLDLPSETIGVSQGVNTKRGLRMTEDQYFKDQLARTATISPIQDRTLMLLKVRTKEKGEPFGKILEYEFDLIRGNDRL